jgi:hypothetical protein
MVKNGLASNQYIKNKKVLEKICWTITKWSDRTRG